MEKLLELGFKKIGFWKKNEKNLSFELSEFKDSNDIIFAFVQNSTVVYMATTNTENIENTLNTFINPEDIDLEKIGIKNLLLKSLDNGSISIYALRNKKFFGLITKFSPIKIASIIKEINPSWNSDDLKDRMKNIVGKDRNAVLKSEQLKEKEIKNIQSEKENTSDTKDSSKITTKGKTKKQHESYIFILGKSYYERGFFNLKTSYSHLVGDDKADIQIVLVGKDKYTIPGKVNRTANPSKAARIIGNKALKIWFQENVEINSELRITFISKKKIRLELA